MRDGTDDFGEVSSRGEKGREEDDGYYRPLAYGGA